MYQYHPRDPITGRPDGIHYSYYDSASRPPSPRAGYSQHYESVHPVNPYPLHDSTPRIYSRSSNQYLPASNRIKPEPLNRVNLEPLNGVHPVQRAHPVDRVHPVDRAYLVDRVYNDHHPKSSPTDQPSRSDLLNDKPPSYHSDAPLYGRSNYDSSASMRQKHQYWNSQKIHKTSGLADQYGGGNHGGMDSMRCRKCVAVICGIIAVLLLIGAILGLYFGIKEALKQQEKGAPENNVRGGYAGGYYVNGVYVVPVTSRPGYTYLIYGTEVPCNQYNNNSVTIASYPDCNKVTTRIVWAAWTTTTPRTIYLTAGSTTSIPALENLILSLPIVCLLCKSFFHL